MKYLSITLILITSLSYSATASEDEDVLLQMLPAIIAATNNDDKKSLSVREVERLAGRWRFSLDDTNSLSDYFRFNPDTAVDVQLDLSRGAEISGESHSSATFNEFENQIIGIYSLEDDAWGIIDPWGPPLVDFGYLYLFFSITDRIDAARFLINPSTGELVNSSFIEVRGNRISESYKPESQTSGNDIKQNKMKSVSAYGLLTDEASGALEQASRAEKAARKMLKLVEGDY